VEKKKISDMTQFARENKKKYVILFFSFFLRKKNILLVEFENFSLLE